MIEVYLGQLVAEFPAQWKMSEEISVKMRFILITDPQIVTKCLTNKRWSTHTMSIIGLINRIKVLNFIKTFFSFNIHNLINLKCPKINFWIKVSKEGILQNSKKYLATVKNLT